MDILKRKKDPSKDSYNSPNFIGGNTFTHSQPEKSGIGYPPPLPEKKQKHKVLKKLFIIFSLAIFFYFSFFTWKIHSFSRTISISNETPASLISDTGTILSSVVSLNRKVLKGEEDGRINILLLGAAGKGNPGQNLTDTIMIASIDTKNKKVGLFSLPRDFYAKISGTNYFTKINSIYQYGISSEQEIEPINNTIEEITGLPIHYFIVLDFNGFKKIIDDIGGINVEVKRDIYDASYPGPNYSYQTFEIKKGLHNMDGETALKYVRERHYDPEGDFGRAKRQQEVMQSAKNKIFSAKTFLDVFALNKLFDDLGNNIKTNLSLEEIGSLLNMSKQLDTQNIANAVADAWKPDSILKVSHIETEKGRAFVLIPRVGNYSEIQDLAKNIFDLDSLKRRRAEIEKEEATVMLTIQNGGSATAYKIKNLLENKLKIKNVKIRLTQENKIRQESSVIDQTNGQKLFTLDEIVKKLPAKLLSTKNNITSDDAKSDFVVFLGKDLDKIYSLEEDSIENLNKTPDSQDYFKVIEGK
jgi:LCP family protein required for cell wall assembly